MSIDVFAPRDMLAAMDDTTKQLIDVIIEIINLVTLLGAAVWAYFRFRREGTHSQRIEFDLKVDFLGLQAGNWVAMFSINVLNKGLLEHRFSRISLRVLGTSPDIQLKRRPDQRLEFPEPIVKAELVTPEMGYYFVRPGVQQTFTFTTSVPEATTFLLARAAFKYHNSDDLHTTERAFPVPSETSRSEPKSWFANFFHS